MTALQNPWGQLGKARAYAALPKLRIQRKQTSESKQPDQTWESTELVKTPMKPGSRGTVPASHP